MRKPDTRGAAAPDTSPANPTAVLETQVLNGGINGYFPLETTEKRYVRANMRREENNTKGTGTFSGFLLTAVTGQADTTISRLDRKLRWTLSHGKKEYTECPVYGCPVPAAKDKETERQAEERQKSEPKQESEPGCVMRVANNSFNVKPTGQKRAINGFNAEQYQAVWLLTMQDNQKRSTSSMLSIDIWTTPLTSDMRQALSVDDTFERSYVAGLPGARPAAADRAAFTRVGKQLEQIKGHPVSTSGSWTATPAHRRKRQRKPRARARPFRAPRA